LDYFTAKQAAEKWGITANRITILCKGGKIPGAMQIGSQWMIPNGTKKPADGRTKKAKEAANEVPFRFPLYVNCRIEDFIPPLTGEESLLRNAQLDYYACRFDPARETFDGLSKRSENTCIKIMALFYLCSLSVEAYGGANFLNNFHRLQLEFAKEFPHKKDMEVVMPWLYTIMVQPQAVSDNLHIDPLYDYSPTVQPLISYLSCYHSSKSFSSKNTDVHLDVYEMLCGQLLQTSHYYEACELHFLLFLAYYVTMQTEAMLRHLKKGLALVQEYGFYMIAASYEFYYQDTFAITFQEFPADFVKRIQHSSKRVGQSVGAFAEKYNHTDIFIILSKDDYRYLMFAFQGNSNKSVARILHISERTVAAHYAALYEKLGIKGKQELVALCQESLFKRS